MTLEIISMIFSSNLESHLTHKGWLQLLLQNLIYHGWGHTMSGSSKHPGLLALTSQRLQYLQSTLHFLAIFAPHTMMNSLLQSLMLTIAAHRSLLNGIISSNTQLMWQMMNASDTALSQSTPSMSYLHSRPNLTTTTIRVVM